MGLSFIQRTLFELDSGLVKSHKLSVFSLFLALATNGESSIDTTPYEINRVVHELSEINLFTASIIVFGICPILGQ